MNFCLWWLRDVVRNQWGGPHFPWRQQERRRYLDGSIESGFSKAPPVLTRARDVSAAETMTSPEKCSLAPSVSWPRLFATSSAARGGNRASGSIPEVARSFPLNFLGSGAVEDVAAAVFADRCTFRLWSPIVTSR